jgi:hypothetical protein
VVFEGPESFQGCESCRNCGDTGDTMTYGGSTNATFVGTGTLSAWGIDYEGDVAIFHQVDQVWTAFLKFDHLFDLNP